MRAATKAASAAPPGLFRLLALTGLFMMLVQVHRSSGAVIANNLSADGFTPSQIATVVSAMFLASALFQLPAGVMFDRYGARLTLAGLGLVAVAGVLVFALSDSVLGLSAGRFLIGVGHGGAIAGIYLLALAWVAPHRVATTTGGIVAVAGGIGGVLATAPLVLALDCIGRLWTFVWIAAATLIVTLAIGAMITDKPPEHTGERRHTGETLAQSLRGLWEVAAERKLWPVYAMGTCFSVPFHAIGGLWSGPYLLDAHGFTEEQASVAVLGMVAAFHLGNLLYGPAERLFATRKWTIVGGSLAMVAVLLILAAIPELGAYGAVALLVLFCLFAPFYPVLAAHCRGFVPMARAGRAIACVNLMGLTTVFALQKLTGFMIDATASPDGNTTLLGYRLVFVTIGAALVLAVFGYLKVRDVPP
ncbi:MAG: MFS transporter [Gammaproteobacteria bacterium]